MNSEIRNCVLHTWGDYRSSCFDPPVVGSAHWVIFTSQPRAEERDLTYAIMSPENFAKSRSNHPSENAVTRSPNERTCLLTMYFDQLIPTWRRCKNFSLALALTSVRFRSLNGRSHQRLLTMSRSHLRQKWRNGSTTCRYLHRVDAANGVQQLRMGGGGRSRDSEEISSRCTLKFLGAGSFPRCSIPNLFAIEVSHR